MTKGRYCSKECKETIARRALWLAVAEAAQLGKVLCPEAPTLDAMLYGLTLGCAEAGLGVDDDLRASLALSEAGVEARGRWRKDGFAYGIKRKVGKLIVHVPGKGPVEFADWTRDRLMETVEMCAPKGGGKR